MTWDQFRDLLPVLTFVAGYLGSLATELVREHLGRSGRREAEKEAFQRESLLQLQDALTEAMAAATAAFYDRSRAVGGELDGDLAQRAWRCHLDVYKYSVRVIDDELRNLADTLADEAYRLSFGTSTRAAGEQVDEEDVDTRSRLDVFMEKHDAALQRLGEVLRALY